MWYYYHAELWTFDPSVDPPCMEKYDQFGRWIFVYRNPNKDPINKEWRQINKEKIACDPGGNIYETIYCDGTGDVFYLGAGLGDEIRKILSQIKRLQSERDDSVNCLDEVKEANDNVEAKSRELFQKVYY